MKKILPILFVLLVLFVLTACKQNSGKVINKQFQKEYYTEHYSCSDLRNPACAFKRQVLHPAVFALILDLDGKFSSVEISKEVYDSCNIGDFYNGSLCSGGQ